ncbi:MAG: glycosyltransferase [Chloroflexia bacterium]|nr:glycosyltransferase [Chloroflexia bacterium]
MRILIAVHGYPPEHNGGAERRAERTARAMAERGHDVAVVCIQTDNAEHTDLRMTHRARDGIDVWRMAFNGGANPDPFRWSYDHPELGAVVGRVIDEWHAQVLHLFSGYLLGASTVDAAVARRVRVVIDLTDYWWHCHRINLLTPLGKRCDGPSQVGCARCYAEQHRRFRLPAQLSPHNADMAWSLVQPDNLLGPMLGLPAQASRAARLQAALAKADVLLAPSQFLADFYQRHGTKGKRMCVWRQGVELTQCPLRTNEATLRIGYLGQVKPHKGVDLLIEAWKKLQGTQPRRLEIYGSAAGEPDYERQLSQELAQLPDATWHGTYQGSEVWEVLAQLDVVVVPSRWVENSPNSILEAQAIGVPIVGTKLGGIAELVEHNRNGLLFAVDDSDELAQNLQRLLDEPDLLPHLRAHAMPFFSHQAAMDRLEGLYQQLTRQHTPASNNERTSAHERNWGDTATPCHTSR